MPHWELIIFLVFLPALFCAGIIALNLVSWPRGRTRGGAPGPIAVLIPARNEESHIETCVRRVYASRIQPQEVVVCDDHSEDRTKAILTDLQKEFSSLKVIDGRRLPPGWIGKPHACMQLAEVTECEYLLFLDADTYLEPSGLERIFSLFSVRGKKKQMATLVTAVPRQITGTFFEHLILPLLHLTYMSWLWLPLIWRSNDPRFLAANGQILAVKRSTLEDIGGFSAIRSEIVDDMALCRLAKTRGHTVVFADGNGMARCRMYRSRLDVWKGFSKNLYEGLGSNPLALLAVLALYFVSFLSPFLGLIYALVVDHSSLLQASLVGIGLVYAIRVALAVRFQQSWLGAVLHPFGIVGLFMIAFNSFRWTLSDSIEWSGRFYVARAKRRSH